MSDLHRLHAMRAARRARAHVQVYVCTCIHIRGRLGRPDSHHVRTLSRLVSISAPINVRCTDAVMALDASTVQAISTALAGALSPLLQASQQSAATCTADPSQPSLQSAATADPLTCGSSDRYICMHACRFMFRIATYLQFCLGIYGGLCTIVACA